MQKSLTVKLDNTLYDWVHTYAVQNDLSVSQVVRHALRAHTKPPEAAERPRELSPVKSFNDIPVASTPTKPKPIDEALRKQVLDEWGIEET
jgi:hypothetical protein